MLLSRALLPRLRQSKGRIVNMTSRMGSVEDNTSGGSYGYRASKSALNALTKSFSIDFPDVPVILAHPGFIQTNMTQGRGDLGPDECARLLHVNLIEPFLRDQWKSGQFLHRDGTPLPW
jgi:NAD(P)-dependent dehydrogenase (short-subunit alcohol dehydrogenase family)